MKILNLIVFTLLTSTSLCLENFYSILEIDESADQKTIKRAFRKLSLKYHPDKNPGNKAAHERFLKVNRAYETLMDQEKRQIYDIYGEEGLNQNNLMHEEMHKQKGPNARVDITVDLQELYNGASKQMTITKNVVCPKCHGTGGKLGHTKQCNMCKGRGVVLQEIDTGMGFRFQAQNTCPKCKGKGIMFSENCPHCRGKRILPQQKTLQIEIEKGMKDGENIVFKREAEQHPETIPGDLIVTLKQKHHPFFHSRVDDDLHADFSINLKEALLGYDKQITHLDGRRFSVDYEGVTQPFYVRQISEEGMPMHNYPSQKGNLFLKFNVNLPKKLTEIEKKLVSQLFPDN